MVYECKQHFGGREIPRSAVVNQPVALMADFNYDGTPDDYWDDNRILRRIDEAGSVNYPCYQHSWTWGTSIWVVSKWQGRNGWPGRQFGATIYFICY